MQPHLYRDPALYDILHAPGTAQEVAGLERLAHRFGPGPGRWLEPACGTGRYLRGLARRGHRVAGFDRSPAMVEYAVHRCRTLRPRPRVFVAGMTDFAAHVPPGSIAIAFNPINSIRHLDSDAELQAHLDAMARVLRSGGIYAVGISLSDYVHDVPTEDVWEGRRGTCRVRQVVQYLPPPPGGREEEVLSHLVVERPSGTQHHDDRYHLRTYDPEEWARAVERSRLRRLAVVDEVGRNLPGPGLAYGIHVLTPR